MSDKREAVILLASLLAVGLIVGCVATVKVVPAGNVGVLYSLAGGVEPQELGEGLSIVAPWKKNTRYTVRTQYYTMSATVGEGDVEHRPDQVDALTKEGLKVGMDLTVLYRIDAAKADEIHSKVGPEYIDVIVRPTIRSTIRQVVAQREAKDIYSQKFGEIEDEIRRNLEGPFKEKNIIIEQVLLREVILPITVANAIETKLEAEQQSERMKFILQKESQEAERKRLEARGISDANHIISQGLTEQYLRWYWIQALKDNHAQTVYVPVGQDGMPLFKEVK